MFALGVGRWSEKCVVCCIKVQTRDVRGQKMPKNANVICERPLFGILDFLDLLGLKFQRIQNDITKNFNNEK